METERNIRARHRIMPTLGLVLVTAFLACSVHEGSDLKAGLESYERGDYGAALKELRPLAQEGDATAQYNLGNMYRQGQGVPQDYQEAVRWFRLAAEQGHPAAQFILGALYLKGRGVSKNYVQAHKWFTRAAAGGYKDARRGLDLVEQRLSPAQIAEAQRLAREWKAKANK